MTDYILVLFTAVWWQCSGVLVKSQMCDNLSSVKMKQCQQAA